MNWANFRLLHRQLWRRCLGGSGHDCLCLALWGHGFFLTFLSYRCYTVKVLELVGPWRWCRFCLLQLFRRRIICWHLNLRFTGLTAILLSLELYKNVLIGSPTSSTFAALGARVEITEIEHTIGSTVHTHGSRCHRNRLWPARIRWHQHWSDSELHCRVLIGAFQKRLCLSLPNFARSIRGINEFYEVDLHHAYGFCLLTILLLYLHYQVSLYSNN